jgi:hypothetical protein
MLASCVPLIKANFDLSLGLNEQWTMQTTLVLEQSTANLMLPQLEQKLSQTTEEYRQKGIAFSYQKLSPDESGNIPIQVTMKGQGYDKLNTALGESAISIDGDGSSRVLNFRLSMGVTGAQSTEFTLHGGKILSSNGNQLDGNTVQWVNFPGVMTATMQEPSLLDYALWIVIGVSALVIVFAAILLLVAWKLTRKKPVARPNPTPFRQPYPGQAPDANYYPSRPFAQPYSPPAQVAPPPLAQPKYCVQCRAQIPAQAVFCPQCGAKQN